MIPSFTCSMVQTIVLQSVRRGCIKDWKRECIAIRDCFVFVAVSIGNASWAMFIIHSVFVFGNTIMVTLWMGIGFGWFSVGANGASHNSQDYWAFHQ